MTIKKFTAIAAAAAALLTGSIVLSMYLTNRHEMELVVPPAEQGDSQTAENNTHTLGDMENTPLYYDDTDVLLLPLRNVMEGLGGSVTWERESREVTVAYRGRKLTLTPGETEATLNGYAVTLPKAAEMINGCLYADEALLTAYFTGDVVWHNDSHQITLQTKDTATPIIAKRVITGMAGDAVYYLEVPVIVGLNDANFEKSMNTEILWEMQETGEAFLLEEREESALLRMELHTGMITQDYLSLWWEGENAGTEISMAKNIDLLGQKEVTLADMLEEDALEEVRSAVGKGWKADAFYLTEDGRLMLLLEDADSMDAGFLTTENGVYPWKDAFRRIQQYIPAE